MASKNVVQRADVAAVFDMPALVASELVVEISADMGISRFLGTKAQLIEEGLVGPDFEWPKRTECKFWNHGMYRYWVQRKRLPGSSTWLDCDYWMFDISVVSKDFKSYQIRAKMRELAEVYFRGTPEWSFVYEKARAARDDDKYMALRARLIGDFAPKKRGRKTICD